MTVYAPPVVQIVPWTKASSTVGAWVRTQSSANMGGGHYLSPVTINNAVTYSVPVAAGTYTVTMIGLVGPDKGISTVTLGGVSIGTLDWYAAGAADDTVKTIAGVVVAAAGVVDLTFTAATKNGASSDYQQGIQFVSLHRTDDPEAILTDVTGLPHRVDITPWGGSSFSTVGVWVRSQSNSRFGGATNISTTQNDALTWKVALAAGTWDITVIGGSGPTRGISTVNGNGFLLGYLDWYSAGAANNVVLAITGLPVADSGIFTIEFLGATKNASATNYTQALGHIIFQRTGA